MCQTKVCTKCGIEKMLDEFGKSKTCKDGLRGECKECISKYKAIYQQTYYAKNKVEILSKNRSWEKNHPDRMRELKRRWEKENPSKVKAKNARQNLKPDVIAAKKAWLIRNADKVKTYRSEARYKDRDNLSDSYVRERIVARRGIQIEKIPQELIDLKRVELMIQRQLKEMQNGK